MNGYPEQLYSRACSRLRVNHDSRMGKDYRHSSVRWGARRHIECFLRDDLPSTKVGGSLSRTRCDCCLRHVARCGNSAVAEQEVGLRCLGFGSALPVTEDPHRFVWVHVQLRDRSFVIARANPGTSWPWFLVSDL